MEQLYSVEHVDGILKVVAPYSEYMNDFYRSVNGKWIGKNNYREISDVYYEILMDELRYCFGDIDDVAVDLHIDVKSCKIRDRLIIAGIECFVVDCLNKEFKQNNNVYIKNQYYYTTWKKTKSIEQNSQYFFTKLIMGYFRPFMLKDCTLIITGLSKVRARRFIDENNSWVNKSKIIKSKVNEIAEIGEKKYCYNLGYL